MDIKKRVFGGDVPQGVKQKIQYRQALSKSSNWASAKASITDPIEVVDIDREHNFLDDKNSIADLSSRTPFVRMWTAVNISEAVELDNGKEYSAEEMKTETLEDGQFWKDNIKNKWENIEGSDKTYVVNNHVIKTTPLFGDNISNPIDDPIRMAVPDEQSIDKNYFMKPAAGITSLSNETEGSLGAVKRTTVEFIVHNFHDFQHIYLKYFLRPGAQVFVDFGWDTGYLYDPDTLVKEPEKIEDNLYGNEGAVSISNGDMETVFGHVVNYDASVRDDGGFDCSVEIVSKNVALLSHQISDSEWKDKFKFQLETEAMSFGLSAAYNNTDLYHLAQRTSTVTDSETRKEVLKELEQVSMLGLGDGEDLPGVGDKGSSAQLALQWGVFFKGTASGNRKIFLNFGWFEDKILNKEFGYGDSMEDLLNASGDTREKNAGTLFAKFDSRESFATYNEKFASTVMRPSSNAQLKNIDVIYPMHWGNADVETYNVITDAVPTRLDSSGSEISMELAAMVQDDKKRKRIPLREIWISTALIMSALDRSNTVGELLRNIAEGMNDKTNNILNIGIRSNGAGNNTLSFIDKNQLSMNVVQDTNLFNKLLTFNPYSPDTIVKSYDLKFTMPSDGLSNMIAIQGLGDLSQGQAVDDMIDGMLGHEEICRKNPDLRDYFVKWKPSSGTIASQRYLQKIQDFDTFNFNKDDVFFGSDSANIVRLEPDEAVEEMKKIWIMEDNTQTSAPIALEDETEEDTSKRNTESAKQTAEAYNEKLYKNPDSYWRNKLKSSTSTIVSPLIPIEASLTIYGISGLVPGDLVRINYMPDNFYENSFFQITKVSHELGETWNTSLELQMRVDAKVKGADNKTPVVNKNYLKDGLNLNLIDEPFEDNDKWSPLKALRNIIPIPRDEWELANSPFVNEISEIFKCKWVDDVPNNAEFLITYDSRIRKKVEVIDWGFDKVTSAEDVYEGILNPSDTSKMSKLHGDAPKKGNFLDNDAIEVTTKLEDPMDWSWLFSSATMVEVFTVQEVVIKEPKKDFYMIISHIAGVDGRHWALAPSLDQGNIAAIGCLFSDGVSYPPGDSARGNLKKDAKSGELLKKQKEKDKKTAEEAKNK